MKLSRRINLQLLGGTAIALLLGGLLGFWVLSGFLEYKTQQQLVHKLGHDKQKLLKNENGLGNWPSIKIEKILKEEFDKGYKLDSFEADQVDYEIEEVESFIISEKIAEQNGQIYTIQIFQPEVDDDDLLWELLPAFAGLFVVLLLLVVALNSYFFGRIWRPFHRNLKELQDFKLQQKEKLVLQSSNIREFEQLNKAVLQLTERVRADYQQMKAFTENAAHELQTPLAVMRSKLEGLLQDEQLSESQARQLAVLLQQLSRLSKLNKSLLLLAKIENRQFVGQEDLEVYEVVRELADFYEELVIAKSLGISLDLQSYSLSSNRELLYMVVKNLLENAIKYTPAGGRIEVQLAPGRLLVANSGERELEAAEQLFQRFQKGDAAEKSTGLGLAIVHQIVQTQGWELSYFYQNKMHVFSVDFSSPNLLQN